MAKLTYLFNLRLIGFCGILLVVGLTGCRKPQIQVYRVEKEQPSQPHPSEEVQAAPERIAWNLPEGWKQQDASGMRQGSFLISGKGDSKADCSIIQITGDAGGDLANVNRWRAQLELESINEEALQREISSLEVNRQNFALLDIVSKGAIGTPPQRTRTLVATLRRPSSTWFIKMTGEEKLVAAHKTRFIGFLKSIRFSDAEIASPTDRPSRSPQLRWKAPPAWKEQPTTAMRKASFLIKGQANLQADVSVTSFSGSAGGLLANVNRWRNQIELPSLTELEVLKEAKRIPIHGTSAVIVNMVSARPLKDKGQKVRILGAILPQKDETWFVKIMGDDPLVQEQQTSLVDFLQSLQFPSTKH